MLYTYEETILANLGRNDVVGVEVISDHCESTDEYAC